MRAYNDTPFPGLRDQIISGHWYERSLRLHPKSQCETATSFTFKLVALLTVFINTSLSTVLGCISSTTLIPAELIRGIARHAADGCGSLRYKYQQIPFMQPLTFSLKQTQTNRCMIQRPIIIVSWTRQRSSSGSKLHRRPWNEGGNLHLL